MAALGQHVYAGLLEKHLGILFPNQETYVNARKYTNLRHPVTGSFLELDFWIPDYDLAFEFQDSHHYAVTWYSHRSKKNVQRIDRIKKGITQQQKISLVIVPCWWDGSIDSLAALIYFERPDLVLPGYSHSPISLNPPIDYFPSRDIPSVGELMLASFAIDLKHSQFERPDSSLWWLGEKYDGVRCCWHPLLNELYTRAGNELLLLPEMAPSFPPVFLDAELWFGRQSFGSTYALFKGFSEEVNWHFLRIIPFDVPAENLQKQPFEYRYTFLLSSVSISHPFLITAQRLACQTPKQLGSIVEGIIDNKGEGVIMRKSGSRYIHGRSSSLIKMKTSYADKEAIVIAITTSKAVRLKQPSGKTFLVPATDVHIPTPSVGDVVTYYYESSPNKETPQNPTIYRVRTDVSWEDVLRNAAQEKQYLNEYSRVPAVPTQPRRITSKSKIGIGWHDVRRRRKFFEDFAARNGFDPLVAKNWYAQPKLRDKLMDTKGVSNIFSYHKGSFSRALMDLFPNIGLEKSKLWDRVVKWEDAKNRRKFFENYARENGFDPLVPENWYNQPVEKIMSTKWVSFVNQHHNRSASQALIDLFPEIGLEKSKLWLASWHDENSHDGIEHEKAFFAKRAPNSNSWKTYAQQPIHLFEDSGWARLKFWDRRTWHSEENRKKFFLHYARANQFDPKNPENWYSQEAEKIRAAKGAAYVLYHHKNKISQALIDLFPDIGLEKFHFSFADEIVSKKKNFGLTFL